MTSATYPKELRPCPGRAAASREPNAPSLIRKLTHGIVGGLFILVGVTIIVAEGPIRAFEAHAATQLAGLTYANETMFTWSAGEPAIGFTMGDRWMVLRITIQCAIALYVGPIAIVGGLLALSTRINLARIALATVIGVVGMTMLNQLRLLAIGLAWGTWGETGFSWAHGPLGTALMLVGIAGILLTFFLVAVRTRTGTRAPGGHRISQ